MIYWEWICKVHEKCMKYYLFHQIFWFLNKPENGKKKKPWRLWLTSLCSRRKMDVSDDLIDVTGVIIWGNPSEAISVGTLLTEVTVHAESHPLPTLYCTIVRLCSIRGIPWGLWNMATESGIKPREVWI